MNIVIVGAGTIGSQIARSLSSEEHSVFIVDLNKKKLESLESQSNLLAVVGNIANIKLLEQVNIAQCDVFIATTEVDETNMVSCLAARKFQVPLKIARVRDYLNHFYSARSSRSLKNSSFNRDALVNKDDFGIDVVINPEEVAAQQIVHLIHSPEAFEIVTFEKEQLQIKGFKISANLAVTGMKIKEFANNEDLSQILVLAIIRENTMTIPRGSHEILEGDKVYIIGKNRNLHKIASYFQESYLLVKQVFIIGVSNISQYLCQHFETQSIRVKLIEPDKHKAEKFAEEYPSVDVIHAEPTDLQALLDEGLKSASVFIAVSDDDEKNLLSAMLAKKNEVKKTFAKLQNDNYLPFTTAMGIDAVVNPKSSAVGEILKYVRKGNVLSVDTLSEKNVEATSYKITDNFVFLKIPIKSISMPKDSLIAAIIRDDTTIIPKGDDCIREGDKVITFYHTSAMEDISKLFGR